MTEADFKNIFYGVVRELMKDSKYFYNGYQCHFTDEGKQILTDLLDLYAPSLIDAIREEDNERSKQLVLQGLKGEKS